MHKKVIALIIVLCFLTISLNHCAANSEPLIDPSILCYGFILPNVHFDDKSIENQIFCRIRHLVNDLLREEILVFWTSNNISINVSKVNSDVIEELFYEKGSFVVPFTGDNTIDTKIIAIICDYNQSSEIEENNNIRAPVYLLMNQFNVNAFNLPEVKVAQYINFLVCGESWYADIANKCGFLDFDFIINKDTRKKLNNSAYNLLIWPGFDMYYPSSFAFLEVILDLSSRRTRTVRDFVSNGGGFVGSCYPVNLASRGVKPLIVYPSCLAHNPKLPSIGLLAISDIISAEGKEILLGLEQEILDTDHPVAYGVDSYLYGGLGSGPMVVDVGEGVSVIAEFKNDSMVGDTPSIVSNRFGDGKVVLFGPHFEIGDPDTCPKFWDLGSDGDYNGKKLVTNAFYYSTSKEETEQEVSESRPMSFINEVWNETSDLSYLLNEQVEIFEEIKKDIGKSIENITNLIDNVYSILETIDQIRIEQNIDPEEKDEFLYYLGTDYIIYCFDLVKEYLENTSITIETIEKIYPLFENNTNFIEQLEQLGDDLSLKIDDIKEIITVSLLNLQKMENILEGYQKFKFLRRIRELIFKKISHDIEIQTELAFQLMPGGYFRSLKFLRQNWYEYETILATS